MKHSLSISLSLAAILSLASCGEPSFSVKGEVEGAEGKTLLLEKADNAGIWMRLDSVRLKGKGSFSFSGHSPAAPEIYRLALDGSYIYFPVDSTDRISVHANAADFAGGFTLSGSDNAVRMGSFEKQLLKAIPTLSDPDSAKAFKRRIFAEYLQNARGSVVGYYILTKTIDGQPLFSPSEDARYFAAVATGFREFRPDDPRCQLLERTATEGLRLRAEAAGRKRVMEATELGYFPISLPDESGNKVELATLVGKGVPVVLVFEDLSDPDTAILNAGLKSLAEAGRIKVYSVGLDADRLIWSNAARNLPFTTVYANVSDAREVCPQYQVSELPTMFLISPSGSITSRPADLESLRKEL